MFKTAVDKGSFTAAGRALGKGTSTVSNSIINLETHLGVELFDRSTKYPTLTEDGKRLFEQASVLLMQVQIIEASAMSSVEKVENRIRLGVGELIPFAMIDETLEKMSQKFPQTRISVIREDSLALQRLLAKGELDLALHVSSSSDFLGAQEFYGVGQVPLSLVCSPDSELADMDVVSTQQLYARRQLVCRSVLNSQHLTEMYHLSPEVWDVNNQDDLIRMVEQDLGWAAIPTSMAEERFALGTLKEFRADFSYADLYLNVDLWLAPGKSQGPVVTYLKEQLKLK